MTRSIINNEGQEEVDELKELEELKELQDLPPQATEEEQRDFEEYEKEVQKQQSSISSYEDLLSRKEEDEKRKELKTLNNKLGEKYINLYSQQYKDPGRVDRLGKTADYYLEVWERVKTNTLFDGDLNKQLRLLRLLASQESETTPADRVLDALDREFKGLV